MNTIENVPRRRLVTNWLVLRLPAAAGLCAFISVILGVIGYHQFRAKSSIADLLYSSIRLLIIDGPDGTISASPPLILDIARFLAIGASSATLLAVLVRSGSARSDRWRARRSTHHIVVFGSTPLAEELAVTARTLGSRARPRRVILIGNPDEDGTAQLRARGITVVPTATRRYLVPLLRGVSRVIIAESSDTRTLERFTIVRDIVGHHKLIPEGPPIDVRLVLAASELARLLRAQAVNNPEPGLDLSAVSVPEAVANALASARWSVRVAQGARDHAIVVGEGEIARTVAMTVAAQRSRRGEPLLLTLLSGAGATWPVDVRTRFASDTLSVALLQGSLGPDWVTRQIAEAVRAGETVHIYVVGLPDADLYTIGHRLTTQIDGVRVLTVPEGEQLPGSLLAVPAAPGTEWFRPLVRELVSDPGALEVGIPQRLGQMLLESVQLTADLPGHAALHDSLRTLLADPMTRQRWSSDTALALLGVLRAAGFHLGPGRTERALVLNGRPLFLLRHTFAQQLSAVAVAPLNDNDLMVLQRTGTQVPVMLQRIGVELIAPPNSNYVLTNLDQLAEAVHEHYLATKSRVGSTEVGTLFPWGELDESQREASRAQVRDIPSKLADLGLAVVPATDGVTFELSPKQLEVIARAEHTRWMTQKLASGWEYGAVRDDERKVHNLFVDYDDLDEAQRELDREPARRIPHLLQTVGLAARPIGDVTAA